MRVCCATPPRSLGNLACVGRNDRGFIPASALRHPRLEDVGMPGGSVASAGPHYFHREYEL